MRRTLLNFAALSTITLVLVAQQFLFTSASVGICYGLNGDNLPSPSDVVNFYKSQQIPFMRLYEPNHDIFNALQGSGIKLAVGPKNEDLPSLSNDPNTAYQWVQTNLLPYKDTVAFGWIVVGNEVVPGDLSSYVVNAMNNIWTALNSSGLTSTLVSTASHGPVLGTSYPPSAGAFSDETIGNMTNILTWLTNTGNPLFVNVHPYWTLASDPAHIDLDYALFKPTQPVIDGNLTYNSLFEATVDAFYSAMEKSNAGNLGLVIGETGWPSVGNDPYTSVENARVYNQNLINLVKVKGTPKRPTNIMDVFIFAMFNEDLKPGELEQHWGLHYPDMSPVYPLTF